MLTVACVWAGSAYSWEYVERLYDMVRRNLPAGFAGRFVCFTDNGGDAPVIPGVEYLALPRGLFGWWNKLALFAPQSFEQGERVLYFDLDTCITGPLDDLAAFDFEFGILRDAYRPDGLQSAVMAWTVSARTRAIWSRWRLAGGPMVDRGGDQAWIELMAQSGTIDPVILQERYAGQLRSFKAEARYSIPRGTSVIFFHGHPRPHEVEDGWVPHVWKVGGGSVAEFVTVGTVDQSRVLDNVRAALAARWPVLEPGAAIEATAVICGGGPALKDYASLISNLQRAGAAIFSCNQADRFLRDHNIQPNFHVMLDARPELAAWVNPGGIKLYASMCDPETLKRGDKAGELTIWHAVTDGAPEIVGHGLMIGGGDTVGLRAICVAYAMGFRRIALVGMDSCYLGGEHHAYPQELNDGERVLDVIVAGKHFRAAPWMAKQADQFRELVGMLGQMGASVMVYGPEESLLRHMAAFMASQAEQGEYRMIEGELWPARDLETRPAVHATLPDLARYISLTFGRKVAVQAGGNVGTWARELAQHFSQVFTVEPSPENFHCLERNLAGLPNVVMRQAALAESAGRAAVALVPRNCGATQLSMGDTVDVITIDSLGLTILDLLILDVEGSELPALKGAEATLARTSPVIVLELKGHGERFGYTDQDAIDWLAARGYELHGQLHRDYIFTRATNEHRSANSI